MPELVNTVVIPGAPFRVWTALTDPERRAKWGPLVYLDHPSRLGATICGFPVRRNGGPIRMDAVITTLDRPGAFAWTSGLPWIYTFSEHFELNGDDGGTSMVHSVVVRGALGWLVGPVVLARLRKVMIESDERLARYLHARVTPPPATPIRGRRPERQKRRSR